MAQQDNYDMEKDGVDTETRGAPGTTGTGSEGSAAGGVSGSGSDGDVGNGDAENILPGMRGVDTRTTGGIGFVTKDGINTETSVVPATNDENDKSGSSKNE